MWLLYYPLKYLAASVIGLSLREKSSMWDTEYFCTYASSNSLAPYAKKNLCWRSLSAIRSLYWKGVMQNEWQSDTPMSLLQKYCAIMRIETLHAIATHRSRILRQAL
jgi:hypothetical protein